MKLLSLSDRARLPDNLVVCFQIAPNLLKREQSGKPG